MADKLKLPTKAVDSDWRDDVDVDYAIYGDSEKGEREYVSPESVGQANIERIKNQKIGHFALFRAFQDETV